MRVARRIGIIIALLSLLFFILSLGVLPFTRLFVAIPVFPNESVIITLTFWVFSVSHAFTMLGWKRTLFFLVSSMVISWGFEQAGVATGFIYGHYHYTDAIGPKLGYVPFLVPVGWFMMFYPCYTIANMVADGEPAGTRGPLLRMLWLSSLGAMAITCWDLVMDPYGSGSANPSWVWENGGVYFGIPLRNFAGWFVTAFTVFLVYRCFERKIDPADIRESRRVYVILPVVVYATVMFNYILPATIPAFEPLRAVAFFGMGTVILTAVGRFIDTALNRSKIGMEKDDCPG